MRKRACWCILSAAAVAAAASGCAAAAQTGGTVPRHQLAARYLVIARAGNHHLETDFSGLDGRGRHDLAAARAYLRDAAATERRFDRRLLAIRFPPQIAATARLLVYLNEARARITSAAAALPTLQQLRAGEAPLRAANAPVELEVARIRKQLGLPPPQTS
jgi:hypothetical protein